MNIYIHSEEPESWEERKDSRHRMFTYVLGNPRLGKKATQSLRVLSCSVSVFLLCRLCCSRFLPQSRVLQHTYVNIVWAPLAFFRSLGLLSIYVNILCAAQAFFRSLGFFSMYVNIVCAAFDFFRSLGFLSIYVNIEYAAFPFFRSLGLFGMYANIVCCPRFLSQSRVFQYICKHFVCYPL